MEAYPGEQFAEEESRCLFFDGAETAHLYDPEFWAKTINPGMENWRRALAAAGVARPAGSLPD